MTVLLRNFDRVLHEHRDPKKAMMKKSFFILCLSFLVYNITSGQTTETVHVNASDITNGYIVKKVSLRYYQNPKVVLNGAVFANVDSIPAKASLGNAGVPKLFLGAERKKPFVLIEVPVYAINNGKPQQLTDFSLTVTEEAPKEGSSTNMGALAKTTGSNSVLASGSWYKIAVGSRGVVKVDYEFLKTKLGLTGSINSAAVRLFGNGGTVIPENNATQRFDDLRENAIMMFDGGDGVFNQGDYFLFYANGPMGWLKDSINKRFIHQKNLYEDKSYYFINVDGAAGERIATQSSVPASNTTVIDFNDYTVHEEDLVNVGNIGKEWLGEDFSTLPGRVNSRSFSFNLGALTDSVHMHMYVASKSGVAGNIFTIYNNGQNMDYFSVTSSDDYYLARYKDNDYSFMPGSVNPINIRIDYQPAASDGVGYLNYLEFNTRRQLGMFGSQVGFRDWKSVGAGKVAKYDIQGANGNVQVWDVTDPTRPIKMNGTLNGGTYSVVQDASSLHEFAAFDGGQFTSPEFIGQVGNQNLHGSAQTDMIIVTDPMFVGASNKLADFHRQHDNMRVLVATTTQIYNEFGSGSKDISAIRDFTKMFYDRAGVDTTQMPKYLLLMGDASYDYKDRLKGNTNYVPTFESAESFYIDFIFCNDDFFGFLDNNENIADYRIANTLDIGVGRLPVQTNDDALAVVDKIIHYKSPASLGPWRLANTFVGDNEDGAGYHLTDADNMCSTVDHITPIYNDTKVYLDSYPFISTPGGTRCPDANKSINDQVYKGTFVINYNGHGNAFTLAHERILTADDFNNWKNYDKLPFMVTATCEFSQFDNPAVVSAGEKLIMKRDGGVIAMLTTTQAVYAYANALINSQFLQAQFTQNNDGSWNTFGDAIRIGKNVTYNVSPPDAGTIANFRKFTLLGDPALVPDFPKYFVHTESLKKMESGQVTDSISALGGYTIAGKVTDVNGTLLDNFNGTAYVSIYDKPRIVSVVTKELNMTRKYQVRNNLIYKGKATVVKGRFSFSFIAPKDINYDFGSGKVSYYAENGTDDAAGIDTTITVGGASDNPVVDNDGPIVKPYMNDSLFKDGGITGTNSILYVSLFDETGINVSGNNVGHDLTAILDGDLSNPYILNDYYETAANEYKRGFAYFPVTGLPDGAHTFTVKAWDVNNNSGEGTVRFVVYNGKVMAIDKLMNYPNPFSTLTHFVFEHNHPDEEITVKIRIYNTAGLLIRTLDKKIIPEGSRTNEVVWDGTDDNGAKLPDGIYIYRLNLSTAAGVDATAYQKAVLIR